MIIAGTAKQLVAAVHTAAGAQVATGTVYCVARLEQSGNADDGKYWDGDSWETSPGAWPTAAHTQAGQWSYTLPLGATTSRAGATIHYSMTDNLTEASATTVCGGGEHRVEAEDALTTTDVTTLIIGADGDTLETLSDQLDTVGGMDGALQLVVHLRDALSAAIPAGKIAVYDSANAVLITEATADNDGNATIALTTTGTYKLRCARAGYGFTSPETVVFASDGQVATITGASLVLTPASDAQYCRVQTTAALRDASGAVLAGYVVRFIAQVPQVAQGGVVHSRTVEATTNASGHLTSIAQDGTTIVTGIDLLRASEVATLAREAGYPGTTYRTVPDAPTQDFATWV